MQLPAQKLDRVRFCYNRQKKRGGILGSGGERRSAKRLAQGLDRAVVNCIVFKGGAAYAAKVKGQKPEIQVLSNSEQEHQQQDHQHAFIKA